MSDVSIMPETEFYYTIEKPALAEFKDRGSKFVAYSFPIQSTDDFKKRLEQIRKEHPKGNHHCFAYRLGLEKNVFRVSDAGEPSGTAGKPILGQIDSKSLTDILIVVVRYFGGTLLGVPGLINAYKSSAALVLQVTPVVQKAIETPYLLEFDYTRMNDVMMIVKQLNCSIIQQDMNLFCNLRIGIPKSKLQEALYRFGDLRGVEVKRI
jgi:uncharacterized YigZ family protein